MRANAPAWAASSFLCVADPRPPAWKSLPSAFRCATEDSGVSWPGAPPYKLLYRIEGDAVIIFRILDAARDHTRQPQ
jgi:hypothetical protein